MTETDVATFHGEAYTQGGKEDSELSKQTFEDVADLSALSPLDPKIISRQATVNIGTVGHVAHGKSTIVKAISGVKTVRFKRELVNNITIKLGYANAKLYRCGGACQPPSAYAAFSSSTNDTPPCKHCGAPMELQRHVSFVDCPGHDILMATMLNGAAVMDAALLLIAGNEHCPQPQTLEHLAAVEMMRLPYLIILQNKIDLVKETTAVAQHKDIRAFVRGTIAEFAPIVPVSAQLGHNIDVVVEYLCKHVPIPKRDFVSAPRLTVIRSFDINKPGEDVESLKGGVAGGTITRGVLMVGMEIEIRPGVVMRRQTDGNLQCHPIKSKVNTLQAEQNNLLYAVPGGLIGVGTSIDPTLSRADRLVGQVLGSVGNLPSVFVEIEVSYFLMRRLLGVKVESEAGAQGAKIGRLEKGEMLMINVGSTSTGVRVLAVQNPPVSRTKLALTHPVCTEIGEKVALSRKIDRNWRLIGWGHIKDGVTVEDKINVAPSTSATATSAS